MKDGGFSITGEPIGVQVLNAEQRALERRVKQVLEGRTVERVSLYSDRIELALDNGETFSFMATGITIAEMH